MVNRRYKKIGTENDQNGEKYQLIVRDYLEDKTGEFGIVNFVRGVDVVFDDYKVEVKGAKAITTVSNAIYGFSYVSFRVEIAYITEELTHFCFLVADKRINSVELLYFVKIEKVLELVDRHHALKRKSKNVYIPFIWVLTNYDPKISKID